jgi:hypothetical protein
LRDAEKRKTMSEKSSDLSVRIRERFSKGWGICRSLIPEGLCEVHFSNLLAKLETI